MNSVQEGKQTTRTIADELFDIFPWNEQLDTGIAIVDEQHRKLVEILNRLARQHMRGVDDQEIHNILHELADYAEYHFSTEEGIWARYFVADEWFVEHEKAHQAFFAKIQSISQSEEPFSKILEQLFSFLIQWLAFHIIDSDKRMAKAVVAREQGSDIKAAKQRANDEMSGSTSVLIQTVLSMYDHLSSQAIELIREKHARQRMEEALTDSEARWRLLLEDSEDVLWDWQPNEPESERNLATKLGSDGWLLPEEESTRLCKAIATLVADDSENTLQLRYRLEHASGELRWVRLRCRVVQRDATGQATRLIGIRNDASRTELAELIYQHGNDAMMVTDGENRILSVNPAFEQLTGYREDELLGANPIIFTSQRTRPEILKEMNECLERDLSWKGEVWNRHQDGHEYVASLSIRRINQADGRARLHVVIANDLTERTRTRLMLEQQHQIFENALDAIDAGSWKWDILSGELIVNARWAGMLGYQVDELMPVNIDVFLNLVHPEERTLVQRSLDAHFTDASRKYRCEIRMRHKEGHWVWVLTQGKVMEYDADGKPWKMFGLHVDINEQKTHADHLEYVALHDVLTGLPNRALFAEELVREMADVRRTGGRLAVAYLDVDDFSELNQQYGRELGDKLLVALSQILRSTQRENNLLARVGGDEFVLAMLELGDNDDFLKGIDRFYQQLAFPQNIDGVDIYLSISMGISVYPQSEQVDADQLLRQADQAMYQAKQLGKHRYYLFDAEGDLSIRQHHQKLERVRVALEQHEFVLHYQPKVDMQTGELISLEALIRWQHPELGLLPPIDFIPLIEQHLLAIEVGDWVIEETLRQLAEWNALGLRLTVSVNIAGPQLQDDGFLSRLKRQLAMQPTVSAEQLELEILETAALEDMGHVADLIEHCRAIDIHFALDDFGTGYSSLNYLKKLAAQTVKIDQSFVRHMLEDSEHVAIIHSIVGLAKTFNRRPLAEGVESEEHGKMLLQLGCLYGQGYGIARPMPARQVADWISTWQPYSSWRDCKTIPYEHIPSLFAEIEYRAWFKTLAAMLDGHSELSSESAVRYKRFQQWLDNPATRELYVGRVKFTELEAVLGTMHAYSKELLARLSKGKTADTEQSEGIQELYRQVLQILMELRLGSTAHRSE